MFEENLYDDYIEALMRIFGVSEQHKINTLFKEIFFAGKANTNRFSNV